MGGHGGLNILPQKKWNVYNRDNRAVVARDKKEEARKKRQRYERNRASLLSGRLDVLIQDLKPQQKRHQTLDKNPLLNSLNAEFKKINSKSHINLFQKEQKIIENMEILQIKKLKEAEFLKDKNMDYSSQFLGTYADGNKKSPWYSKQKGFVEQKKPPTDVQSLLSVKKSDSHTINQVVKIEKEHIGRQQLKQGGKSRSRSRSRSRQKNKIKLQQRSQLSILRQKRLKRQQKQKQKALKLKMMKSKF